MVRGASFLTIHSYLKHRALKQQKIFCKIFEKKVDREKIRLYERIF